MPSNITTPSLPEHAHPGHRIGEIVRRTVTAQALKTAGRVVLEGAVLAVVVSVAGQLAYPQSRALPQTRIGGKEYGYQSEQQITAGIAGLQGHKLHITTSGRTLERSPKELGITFEAAQDAGRAVQYGWRERLVPFSLFFERREIPHYTVAVDEAAARQFAASLKQYDKAPVDAAVKLEGAEVTVTRQQDGYSYDIDQIVRAIKDVKLTNGMSVALQPKTVQPATTDRMAAEAARALQQRLQQPITVRAGGRTATADPALIASWAVVAPDDKDGKLHIVYDKEKVKQWLAQLAGEVYVAAVPRTVTMLDGTVVSETGAADGQALDVEATAAAVVAAASANQPAAEGKLQPVTSGPRTIRNYSRSSQGLQALLQYWDQSHAGTWGIVLEDFAGNIAANINPDRQFTSASVYKLYIAYVVYTKADNGELSMGAATGNGKTVSACLDIMIVRSDNACAQALGDMIGWNANDSMLQAKGFASTTIAQGAQLTTARDAASYLRQLQNGTLLSAGNRDALLDKMGRNIYRYAIPAGSPGMHSVNKLGALGAYNHDVAIVYHPKGAYVLSVFTYGSSHAQIRELARQVAAVMGQ